MPDLGLIFTPRGCESGSLRRYMNAVGRAKADLNVDRVLGRYSDLYCLHFGKSRSAWPAHSTTLFPCDRENVFTRRKMQYDPLGCAQKGNRTRVDSHLKRTC